MFRAFLLIAPVTLLTACSPQMYESEPVSVKTPSGTVICQLYTRETLAWDRAIAKPESMSDKEAKDICLGEGRRWMNI